MQHPRTALLQLVVLAVLAALAATTTALPTVGEIESLSNVADGGAALDADKQARIGELEVAKQRAIAVEDYDDAKRIKLEIEELKLPPPPPPPSQAEEEATKQALMIETVKKGIIDVRDRNHGGDTHKFFDHLDHTDDEHLEDVELMTILGADPKKPKKTGGMFSKIMDGMVAGMKKSMDLNGDGKVHRDEFHALIHADEA